jgi:hypothetical protein
LFQEITPFFIIIYIFQGRFKQKVLCVFLILSFYCFIIQISIQDYPLIQIFASIFTLFQIYLHTKPPYTYSKEHVLFNWSVLIYNCHTHLPSTPHPHINHLIFSFSYDIWLKQWTHLIYTSIGLEWWCVLSISYWSWPNNCW